MDDGMSPSNESSRPHPWAVHIFLSIHPGKAQSCWSTPCQKPQGDAPSRRLGGHTGGSVVVDWSLLVGAVCSRQASCAPDQAERLVRLIVYGVHHSLCDSACRGELAGMQTLGAGEVKLDDILRAPLILE